MAYLATIIFIVGFWLHYPMGIPNFYTDIVDIIWTRIHLYDKMIPYIDYNLEYPALSGILIYVASIWRELYTYYYIISLVSYFSMLVSLYVIYEMLKESGKSFDSIAYYMIFAPSFIFFSVYSFDWLGIMFLLLSLFYAVKGKALQSGLFMGLSVSARLIPLVCAPFIIKEYSKQRDRLLFILTSSLSWLSTNAYFMIMNFEGFIYPYTYQLSWVVEDSWLNLIPTYYRSVSGMLYFWIVCLILFWKKRKFSLFESSFLALLGFVLVSYKFPPQYMILLLPFFALYPSNYMLFITSNLLNVMIIFWWFSPTFNFGNPWSVNSPVQWIAIVRQLLLLPIFIINFFKRKT